MRYSKIRLLVILFYCLLSIGTLLLISIKSLSPVIHTSEDIKVDSKIHNENNNQLLDCTNKTVEYTIDDFHSFNEKSISFHNTRASIHTDYVDMLSGGKKEYSLDIPDVAQALRMSWYYIDGVRYFRDFILTTVGDLMLIVTKVVDGVSISEKYNIYNDSTIEKIFSAYYWDGHLDKTHDYIIASTKDGIQYMWDTLSLFSNKHTAPIQLELPPSKYTYYSDSSSIYALNSEGELFYWFGNLTQEPIKVELPAIESVTIGDSCFALTNDGNLWVWGKVPVQLDQSIVNVSSNSPMKMNIPVSIIAVYRSGFTSLYNGYSIGNYYFIGEDNSLWLWGGNLVPAFGDEIAFEPIKPAILRNIKAKEVIHEREDDGGVFIIDIYDAVWHVKDYELRKVMTNVAQIYFGVMANSDSCALLLYDGTAVTYDGEPIEGLENIVLLQGDGLQGYAMDCFGDVYVWGYRTTSNDTPVEDGYSVWGRIESMNDCIYTSPTIVLDPENHWIYTSGILEWEDKNAQTKSRSS